MRGRSRVGSPGAATEGRRNQRRGAEAALQRLGGAPGSYRTRHPSRGAHQSAAVCSSARASPRTSRATAPHACPASSARSTAIPLAGAIGAQNRGRPSYSAAGPRAVARERASRGLYAVSSTVLATLCRPDLRWWHWRKLMRPRARARDGSPKTSHPANAREDAASACAARWTGTPAGNPAGGWKLEGWRLKAGAVQAG